MIKQTRSYQTSDGQLFSDKTSAILHEFRLETKGLFQSSDLTNKSGNYTINQVADIFTKNSDKFLSRMKYYNYQIRKVNKNKEQEIK